MKATPIALIALACAAPCVARAGIDIGINLGGPEVVVRSAPPVERHEYVPASPGPGFVWIHGHWAWRHDNWEWMSGRWARPDRPGQVWIAGRWVARGSGYVWVEGHFDVVAGPPPPPPGDDVYVDQEPPAPMYEAVPVAPGPEFFWIGGYWHWSGRWTWVHGHYERHPHFHPGASWEAGRWEHRSGHWYWRDGHWH